MRTTWEIHEKYMINTWEIHEKYMRNTWEMHEKYMRNTRDTCFLLSKFVAMYYY